MLTKLQRKTLAKSFHTQRNYSQQSGADGRTLRRLEEKGLITEVRFVNKKEGKIKYWTYQLTPLGKTIKLALNQMRPHVQHRIFGTGRINK